MTITVSRPVAGLPEGPATGATVKAHLKIPSNDERDDAKLQTVIEAVNQKVVTFRIVKELVIEEDTDAWPAHIVLGATLLSARLFKRSGSPAGVETFGEGGVAYVQRNDPDIAMMLGLGAYKSPAVG